MVKTESEAGEKRKKYVPYWYLISQCWRNSVSRGFIVLVMGSCAI